MYAVGVRSKFLLLHGLPQSDSAWKSTRSRSGTVADRGSGWFVQGRARSCGYSCPGDTGRNRQVIIENQLEPTDHRHLGQLLTYAAGLDATVIVWISPEFRDEHREAIDWLNRHTSENVEFFGVALEVVRIGDSKPAVVFRLAASPNAWTKDRLASVARSENPARAGAFQEFFQLVIDELREKH